MPEHKAEDLIGYGKPPRQSRFQKGKSGNPKGRPKGSKNLATIVIKESRQRVHVNGPRGSRTVTKLEAAMMQLGNKSAQGDLRASREFFGLIQRSEDTVNSGGTLPITELDQPVVENLLRRMSNIRSSPIEQDQEDSQ
ncbi:MAG: DUF5681 domain-containing protein [Terracidiphilus sp.]|jgi:hypothetical protein